jgi:flagellar hook-associated protein 2
MAVDYISALNAGSGLNTTQIVDALVEAEKAPQQSALQKDITKNEVSVSAYAQIKSSMATLNTSLSALEGENGFVASSSTSDVTISVTDASELTANSFNIDVAQLADFQTSVFSGFASREDNIGGGTLSFDLGAWNSGTGVFTSQGGDPISITIDPEASSLNDIAAAINSAGVAIKANVVNNGDDTYSLMIKGATGEENGFTISVVEDAAGAGLSALASTTYNASVIVQAAQNAVFDLDGVTIERTSNRITDLIDGLQLDLNAVSTNTGTISVAQDRASAYSKLTNFTTALNAAINLLTEYSKPGVNGSDAGPLAGDSSIRALKSRLAQFTTTEMVNYDGASFFLANFGIQTERTGSLSLDQTKFNSFFDANPTAFSAIFSNGLFAATDAIYPRMSGDNFTPGTYAVEATEATAGKFTGTTPSTDYSTSPLVITDSSVQLDIALDGAAAQTITLATGTYNSLTEVATQMQTQIDSVFGASKLAVSATTGALIFTSAATGTASKVDITDVSTALNGYFGVNSGTSTTGVNRTVTVDDIAGEAFGSSWRINSGNAQGLILGIDSYPLSSSIIATRSMTSMISGYLDDVLASSGFISAKLVTLSDNVAEKQAELVDLDDKMENLRERYMKQYAAMESMVSSLKKTGDYLTSFMDSWSASLKK